MPPKEQHFIPQVYLKAWETTVEKIDEPGKKFQGVYIFQSDSTIGDGRNKKSILWKPQLYTIKFSQMYMAGQCPGVFNYFVNAVYDVMNTNSPSPVYAKLGHSVIRTKKSVRKHLKDIEKWDFYYENGNLAKKKAILSNINGIRCYILENTFECLYESRWENIRDTFINAVKNGLPILNQSERCISEQVSKDMLGFFFMMICRHPGFNAMGVYTFIDDLLRSVFAEIPELDEMMEAIWFTELYKMAYKQTSGFYHNIIDEALKQCQFILFEACNDSEMFLTSDNPAFMHGCRVLRNHESGYIFPLTPKYMLFIAKGDGNIGVVDYRSANEKTVRHFNSIIKNNSHELVIGVKKQLYEML